jgi:hypothetical protein
MQVFRATDHSSPQAECASLVPIGCNDDYPSCGSTQRNSRLCLRNLIPGDPYYIELAAKTENRLGEYRVTLTTSCSGPEQPCDCPSGLVEFIDPPNSVVDARAPYSEDTVGIDTFYVSGPAGATADCWSVCESPPPQVTPTEILGVDEVSPGQYQIRLTSPMRSGMATKILYARGQPHEATGYFYRHPGNVDGNAVTNAMDIVALVDGINQVRPLKWGGYSGDLNDSGVINAGDIITLVDLLNGNGFVPWYGTTLPEPGDCP